MAEKIKKHILSSINLFKNRAVYEILWTKKAETNRTQMTVWDMRIACWITKTTHTHTQWVILTAIPQQQ